MTRKPPSERTAGEIFAAHTVSYIRSCTRDQLRAVTVYGDSAGSPLGRLTARQITSGARPPAGARFMCDTLYLAQKLSEDRRYDATRAVYDLTLERYIS